MAELHNKTVNEAVLKEMLAERDFELLSVGQQLPDGQIEIRANKLQPAPAPSGEVLHVPMPVVLKVSIDEQGRIQGMEEEAQTPGEIADTTRWVKMLVDNRQISGPGEKLSPGATHQIEIDQKGRQIIRRRRFSAF